MITTQFILTCIIGFLLVVLITIVFIMTDKTPDNAYDLLSGKTKTVIDDYFSKD